MHDSYIYIECQFSNRSQIETSAKTEAYRDLPNNYLNVHTDKNQFQNRKDKTVSCLYSNEETVVETMLHR